MQGLFNVICHRFPFITIPKKDAGSGKKFVFYCSAGLYIVPRSFDENCRIANRSSSSTHYHEDLKRDNIMQEFVLSTDEEDAQKIRITILNVQNRSVNNIIQALESDNYCKQMQLGTVLVDSLLQQFGDDWKSALAFFQWAGSRPGYRHTSCTYDKMVDLLGKMKQMDQMWDLVEMMRAGGFMTLETVAKIMRRLAGARRWREAISFFDDLGRMGFEKDTKSMNLLLDTLCKERKVELAREIFIELKTHIPVDAYTFNIFVHGWCNVQRIEEALWTTQEMKGYGFYPSVITYSSILKAYCNQSNFCKVYELLDQMVAEGCPPNVVTYTIVIKSLARSHDVEDVLNVVNRMKSSGCSPDTRFYNTLIYILGNAGRLDDAFHIFDREMELNGVCRDLSTHNIMISLYCQHDKEQEALYVLNEMKGSSCKPVLQTYYPLLKLCFRTRKLHQLKSLLSDIMIKHHLSLDLDAYTLLIHGLCVAGNVEWAYSLFNEMINLEIVPRIRTCRLIMDLAEQRNMNVAVEGIKSLMSGSKV